MEIYFAPLEGITLFPFRMAHRSLFGGVDRYYMPFITVHQTRTLRTKEKKDLLPENNAGMCVIPQLLGNHAEDTLWYLRTLREKGFAEVDLNCGCPSGTVVTKGRGAGMLRDLDALDAFFEQVFDGIQQLDMRLSVKTRIGITDAVDVEEVIRVYNRYPISLLTVHPRLQKQFYKGEPDMEAFAAFTELCRLPLCYNGDITSAQGAEQIMAQYPQVKALMIGRGMIANPALAEQIRGEGVLTKERLKAFHDQAYRNWVEDLGDPNNVVGRMKELWFYFSQSFADCEKARKRIRKARSGVEYLDAAERLFRECALKGE